MEVKEILGSDGKVSAEALLKYLHDNAVGKTSASYPTKFVKPMELGDVRVSLQCSYLLFCARDTIYGPRVADDHYQDIMTEDEWRFMLAHNHLTGEELDYSPLEVNFDVLIRRASNGEDLISSTQMSVTRLAEVLDRLISEKIIIP